MPMNPQVQVLLDAFSAQGLPPFDQMSVPQARTVIMAIKDLQGEPEAVAEVRDIEVPGPAGRVPVRLYYPSTGKALPLVVYYHGGGWVIGDVEIFDRPCRTLANASQCIVASVNYRLSPETKFPGPAEDCYEVTRWLASNAASVGANGRFLAVAGDSAGGNLAAVVSLMARDRGGPTISYQVLIYPVTATAEGSAFPSYRENAEGYFLTKGSMEWFWNHYLASPADGKNPYAAPLSAPDLSRLPPALVVTAQFDPLRDEGREYAKRLQQAGVSVKSSHYDDMIHGFFSMAGAVDRGKEVIAEIASELRKQSTA
jgi:acetyl esterase